MDELDRVTKYDTAEEAEKERLVYDLRKKVKTDVFRVEKRGDKFVVTQDSK